MGDDNEVKLAVSKAILILGVAEVARRLDLKPEPTLRLVVPGANPHRATVHLARANLHRLELPAEAHAG